MAMNHLTYILYFHVITLIKKIYKFGVSKANKKLNIKLIVQGNFQKSNILINWNVNVAFSDR